MEGRQPRNNRRIQSIMLQFHNRNTVKINLRYNIPLRVYMILYLPWVLVSCSTPETPLGLWRWAVCGPRELLTLSISALLQSSLWG